MARGLNSRNFLPNQPSLDQRPTKCLDSALADAAEGSSRKRDGLMDKDGFRGDLSMKSINFMDKDGF